MTLAEVMAELESLGTEQTRQTWKRHGAIGPIFGVKISDMKVILKKIKNDQKLAMELFKTGNGDAMYLAGLVADGAKMSKKELETWAKSASWRMISEYTVPWVAVENPAGHELALAWIDSKKETIACAGWNTLGGLVAILPDEQLDFAEIQKLMDRVVKEIHKAPNRAKYCMNCYIISVGSYVKPMLAKAKAAGKSLGKVEVDVGDTDCKVPSALDYIQMVESKGKVGKKRKTMKC